MLNKELLDNLKAAQEENNRDKFTDLCYTTNVENTLVNGNFHGLGVALSVITESNNSFIENLYDCIDEDDYKRVEHLEALNDKGKFKPYFTEANDLAFSLYSEYEKYLDDALIWLNSEKIIEDLEYYISINEE